MAIIMGFIITKKQLQTHTHTYIYIHTHYNVSMPAIAIYTMYRN